MSIHVDERKMAESLMRARGTSSITLDDLKEMICDYGFEMIDYSPAGNSRNLSILIQSIGVKEYVEAGSTFAYQRGDVRLVFVPETMSDDEKRVALAHELGHIVCGHLVDSQTGYAIEDENQANEFAHYLLNPGSGLQVSMMAMRHRRLLVLIAAAVLFLVSGILISRAVGKAEYYEKYYVTSSGSRYHLKDCEYVKNRTNVRRMTVEDIGHFAPCSVCLYDEL